MPPDVFLVLASSGLTLVASLLFFVSDDPPVREAASPGPQLSFCVPPRRGRPITVRPPPLPAQPECAVAVSTPSLHGVMTLKPQGDEWVVTLETAPMADMPASRLSARGAVHDLRWHGKAGVGKAARRSWRQKPGRA